MHDEDAYRAATMYYLQNQTMEVIAKTLRVSRSTVSRLIAQARAEGMVRIAVEQPASRSGAALGHRLAATFGIRAHVVPVRPRSTELQRLDQVAAVAANLLGQWFGSDMVLGIAWGTTVSAIAGHLRRYPTSGSTVVQLNGAANTDASGVTYASELIGTIAESFGATSVHFPVPAFFDHAQTKTLMWRERSVQRVLEVQRRADLAVFGVGAVTAEVPSHVYSAGYLSEEEMRDLTADGVVGDVCTVFHREDGTYRDIEINQRATGPTPRELRRIGRRMCVVVGDRKVPALLGALRARVATDLVIDETTAGRLLERATARP
ncbi:MAG TPA: sugar-binding domain-containing protein [Actinotalea caeni]|uniref:sugar-binding transcriptional regulator n=1 Tax=Actinotalea caeni TaxID=1348467 RepID=UPI002B4B31D7|nr:sugar-binding domain-containing protein [Actinotalea caeni]HLV54652.1 sugar-binding domain-containing protein [Actinotalea caeni]